MCPSGVRRNSCRFIIDTMSMEPSGIHPNPERLIVNRKLGAQVAFQRDRHYGAGQEVADLRDESAYPGSCGMSVNRCHTADRAEFRRRLLSGHVPCDGRSDSLNDVRTGDISDHAQPTAAVRAERQIDREDSGPL